MPASKTFTRGPLPPEVYWRRRILLLVGAAVLVFIIAQVLGGGSDAKSGGGHAARQAAAPVTTSSSTAPSAPARTPTAATTTTRSKAGPATGSSVPTVATSPLTLAAPSGPCDPSDITVTPQVGTAVAGGNITIRFALETKSNPACTWNINSHTLAVKIGRRGHVVWTSEQCGSELPSRSIVVRNVVPSVASMTWDGRFSTDGCGRSAPWVHPGKLTAWASTIGGEPGHSKFDLVLPAAQTVQVSPKANPTTSATGTTAQPRR
ncbi:MAG: hypothetical protein FWE71_14425 [Nocardioidaceae bacterium]|nr:hypothetical protein [Nocardioidaceae bacterium]MCL2614123.1 hypothetical protein [Nocardioidaceae bacterium]